MSSDDEFRCTIQLPPPMPLLLSSANLAPTRQLSINSTNVGAVVGMGSASSSSSSPGARASSSDINDDSICSGSYVTGKSNSNSCQHGDSGVSSSDDSVSRASYNVGTLVTCQLEEPPTGLGQQPASASSSTHRLAVITATTPQTTTPPPLITVSSTNSPNRKAATSNKLQSNVRPVSPALSHVSFALEPKFHILTDINSASSSTHSPASALQNPRPADDILSASSGSVMLPHFSTSLLPNRYNQRNGVFGSRCTRASTPTTARKAVPLLLSASHHHFPPSAASSAFATTSSTLPRHHVVHIAEADEMRNDGHQSSTDDDDSSSSDDDDARIFSGFRRGRNAMRNNLRKAIANAQQQSNVAQHQHQRRLHPGVALSTIPEQVESPTMTSALPAIISFVYTLLLCSLSAAFVFGESSHAQMPLSSPSPLSASQGFSHFLFVGSLIVAIAAAYKRFTKAVHQRRRRRHRRVQSVNKITGKQQQQYDIIETDNNGRLTITLSSSPSESTPIDAERQKRSRFDVLRRFERSALAVICIASCICYGGGFAETVDQMADLYGDRRSVDMLLKNATNDTLNNGPCGGNLLKQQMVSTALLQFWQLLLTPLLGYLLFNKSQFFYLDSGFGSSAAFDVGIAHLISSQFHSLISGTNYQQTSFIHFNCSSINVMKTDNGAMSVVREVVDDMKPFGNHLTQLFSVFVTAFLLRYFISMRRSASSNSNNPYRELTRESPSSHNHQHFFVGGGMPNTIVSAVVAATSHSYSWSRLCAITLGSLLTTVSVVWNIAIMVALFSARLNTKKSLFVVIVGSSPDVVAKSFGGSDTVGNFLLLAGDGIAVGILVISLIVTIVCAVIVYFQAVDDASAQLLTSPSTAAANPMRFLGHFLLFSSGGVLLVHFVDLLNWTSSQQLSSASSINVWLCYTQLAHAFVQTISLVMCCEPSTSSSTFSSLSSSSSQRRNIRPLFLLNSFANISLFLTATLKTFGSMSSNTVTGTALSSVMISNLPTTAIGVTHQLLSVVYALNSAHYLIAAFILLRLAC